MLHLSQSPVDPAFVQNPYPFYEAARAEGPLFFWEEYGLVCATGHPAVNALLRDGRLGRAPPVMPERPAHLADFYAIDDNSMLELEPPRHPPLRKSVLRAFTSARIAGLAPEITALCHDLIDRFPAGPFDLLDAYARRVPVLVIARLLGVPDAMADQLLAWSAAMVAMYQARRDRAIEAAANAAARDFTRYLSGLIAERRGAARDDLVSALAARQDETGMTDAELVATCVLLLNAGHEATVHTLGNGVAALLGQDAVGALQHQPVAAVVEEILRWDPPLHMFTRHVYEDVAVGHSTLPAGSEVALLLGAAGRDPQVWSEPARFDPGRPAAAHLAFGAGRHFCLGAPLARMELQIALPILFERCPDLALGDTPRYADLYHFHGLERLQVRTGS
jgi:cytochrome P450